MGAEKPKTTPEQMQSGNEKPGEHESEAQSLNASSIREYLEKKTPPITLDNFDEKFNFSVALDLIENNPSTGEEMMAKELVGAKSMIDKLGLSSLLDSGSTTEASFQKAVHEECAKRNIHELTEDNLVKAFSKYQIVKKRCKQVLESRDKVKKQLDVQQSTVEESYQDKFDKLWKDMKKNFNKMSTTEKLMTAGAVIGVTVMLTRDSENPKIQKVKNAIWSGLKLAGGGVVGGLAVNGIWKIFTGKSVLESISSETTSKIGNTEFWKQNFDADDKKAEAMSKAIVFTGDKKFSTLLENYKNAKSAGKKEIILPSVNESDISGEELYTALDTFFSKKGYEVDKLEEKYKKNPNITWREVIGDQLVEDGHFDGAENIPAKVTEYMGETWDKYVEGLMSSGEGLALYKKYQPDKKPNENAVRAWLNGFIAKEGIIKENEMEAYIRGKFEDKLARGFSNVLKGGTIDNETHTHFAENSGDGVYLMSTTALDLTGDPNKAYSMALQKAENQAVILMKRKYGSTHPQVASNPHKYLQFLRGARALTGEGSEFVLFVRMPAPGTEEFNKIAQPQNVA